MNNPILSELNNRGSSEKKGNGARFFSLDFILGIHIHHINFSITEREIDPLDLSWVIIK